MELYKRSRIGSRSPPDLSFVYLLVARGVVSALFSHPITMSFTKLLSSYIFILIAVTAIYSIGILLEPPPAMMASGPPNQGPEFFSFSGVGETCLIGSTGGMCGTSHETGNGNGNGNKNDGDGNGGRRNHPESGLDEPGAVNGGGNTVPPKVPVGNELLDECKRYFNVFEYVVCDSGAPTIFPSPDIVQQPYHLLSNQITFFLSHCTQGTHPPLLGLFQYSAVCFVQWNCSPNCGLVTSPFNICPWGSEIWCCVEFESMGETGFGFGCMALFTLRDM